MGRLELCRLLDRRQLQHQYVDDLVVHDRRWPVVVAGVDMRLAGLLHLCRLHCRLRPHWRRLSHRVPRRQPLLVWHMGVPVAGS